MKSLLFGIVFLTFGFMPNKSDHKKSSLEVINLNFGLIEEKGFKVYHETVPFPIDHLIGIDFFNLTDFKKAFEVYNLGLINLDIIDSNINQEDLDYIKKEVFDINIRPLKTYQLNLHDSIFIIEKPTIIANRPETLFPDTSTYLISWPVFSRDGQFAMIYELKRCGLDCGGGQINFFMKNRDGDWEKIGSIITSLH